MNERWMISSFTASSLIHLSLIPLTALVMHAKPLKPVNMPMELIELPWVEHPQKSRGCTATTRAKTQTEKSHRTQIAFQASF